MGWLCFTFGMLAVASIVVVAIAAGVETKERKVNIVAIVFACFIPIFIVTTIILGAIWDYHSPLVERHRFQSHCTNDGGRITYDQNFNSNLETHINSVTCTLPNGQVITRTFK